MPPPPLLARVPLSCFDNGVRTYLFFTGAGYYYPNLPYRMTVFAHPKIKATFLLLQKREIHQCD